MDFFMKRIQGILIFFCAAGLVCSPARASAIFTTFSIQPASLNASPGDAGDAFDVVLTDNGPASISVQSFSFEVSVSNPSITLTGVDFSTAADAYIFTGDSFDFINSFPLNTSSGQTLDASDATNDGSGITLTAGQSLALGRVLFNVAAGIAPGAYSVSFTGGADFNNLSNPAGGSIPVSQLTGGTITISTVPEPATALLLGSALGLLGFLRRRR
jgi:hypothetical protein